MSKYNKYADSMGINPTTKGRMLEEYPQLQTCVDFISNSGIDSDKYLRYLAWLYDPQSPLMKEYRGDLIQRRAQAMNLSSYNGDSDYRCESAFVIMMRNRLWTLRCDNEKAFAEFSEMVGQPITEANEDVKIKAIERKGKLLELMSEMSARIEKIDKELFEEDHELEDAAVKIATVGQAAKNYRRK